MCGHMTGQLDLARLVLQVKGLLQCSPSKGCYNSVFFPGDDLAKLNPKYHINYSIIFTEISFSPVSIVQVSYHLVTIRNILHDFVFV